MGDRIERKWLKRPDAVLARLREGYQWTQDNLWSTVVIGGGIFFASAIWVGVDSYENKKQEKALLSFYEAERNFEKKRTESLTKKNENLSIVLKDEISYLDGVSKKYPSSHAAIFSLLKLGDFYINQKIYDQAIPFYERGEPYADHPFYRVLMYYNLGFLYEMTDRCEKAIEYYQKILSFNKKRILFWTLGYRPNVFWLTSAYFGIGRCHEKLNRLTEARDMYFRISDEFSETSFSDKAKALVLLLDLESK